MSLGKVPLANALLSEEDLSSAEPLYPLELAWCDQCALAQLSESVPPEQLFVEYPYFSSYSDTMVEHAKILVDRVIEDYRLGPQDLAVEIASNDGYLLQHYVAAGIPVLGIDPARNVIQEAESRGVRTICEFFGADLALRLAGEGISANITHANNVIAHVPDINGVLEGIRTLIAQDGVAIIETPYLLDLVTRLEFDTIYHEHLFYYSLTALKTLLERNGLEIFDVERLSIHGGSLRVFSSASGRREVKDSVLALSAEEERVNLNSYEYFSEFAQGVEKAKTSLRALLDELKEKGASIAAYGASAKGTVLLNAFGIGRERIDFVVDRSPHKQGRFMPGVHIPIHGPERLYTHKPDYVLLLAWNFADEIAHQQREYLEAGGRFILPGPEPRVLA